MSEKELLRFINGAHLCHNYACACNQYISRGCRLRIPEISIVIFVINIFVPSPNGARDMFSPMTAAYAHQDVHVWIASVTCLWPRGVLGGGDKYGCANLRPSTSDAYVWAVGNGCSIFCGKGGAPDAARAGRRDLDVWCDQAPVL